MHCSRKKSVYILPASSGGRGDDSSIKETLYYFSDKENVRPSKRNVKQDERSVSYCSNRSSGL